MSAPLRNILVATAIACCCQPVAAQAAGPPDLRTDPVATSSRTAPAGAALRAGVSTRNMGARRARSSVTALLLSRDARRSRGDRLLRRVKVPRLGARRGKRALVRITVPATARPGAYRVLACADYRRNVRERSERNNCRASRRRFRVTAAGAVVPAPEVSPGPAPVRPAAPQVDADGDGVPNVTDCAPSDRTVHPGAADSPDVPRMRDTNCDGIDGDAARSIFVSPAGDDANAGTRARPKRTITAAIPAASGTSADVLVAAGDYAGELVVVDGVGVYGGYGRGWSRSLSQVSRVQSPTRFGASAADLQSETTLQLLTVRAADAPAGSSSSYGLYAFGAPGLVVERVTAVAGRGGDGAAGPGGAPGEPGSRGTDGVASGCDTDPEYDGNERIGPGLGGAGGSSPVPGRGGGRGGHGGAPMHDQSSANGQQGHGFAGGAGGGGGRNGDPGGTGVRGSDGANGTNGLPGEGGRGGVFSGEWSGSAGRDGGDGTHGHGGGGGGGGGAQECLTCLQATGNGAGGGGGGGEAGTGGRGGGSAGGSFGIALVSSTGAVVRDSSFTAADGGTGGRGGPGALGGPGGVFGNGASECTSEIGRGGRGGLGGFGGAGAAGGGGAGGPSTGLVTRRSEVMIERTTLRFGAGGAGGFSPAGPSYAGRSGEAKVRDQS
jgi:hypothetical protein